MRTIALLITYLACLLYPQKATAEPQRPIALTVLVDKSASMAENQRLEVAKRIIEDLFALFEAEDHVGLIAFDSTPWKVVRSSRAGELCGLWKSRTSQLYPAQQTNFVAALQTALSEVWLSAEKNKFLLILTDGSPTREVLTDGFLTREGLKKDLVTEARNSGISILTLHIRSNSKELSEMIKIAQLIGSELQVDTPEAGIVAAAKFLDRSRSNSIVCPIQKPSNIITPVPHGSTATISQPQPPVETHDRLEVKMSCNVLSSASPSAPVLGQLSKGDIVRPVPGTVGAFVRILNKNGSSGFVLRSCF